ncbi:hypothetical protein ACVINW_007661 [Bradyrhizobium sp. USDA 4461]
MSSPNNARFYDTDVGYLESRTILIVVLACQDDAVVSAPFARSTNTHTGNAVEYFTWLSAKLDSIEAMPSRRVSLFFRNAS